MQTRRFGRTGIEMPLLSCGGMRYQHKWQDVPLADVPAKNQANVEATVRRAVELGINHIETARGYGSSERQLGPVLRQFPRERLIIQTKIGPQADPQKFVAEFHESLERLQVDYVDLFALHGINNHECLWWSLRPGGCLAAARALVAEGKVRHVGFSTHGPLAVILAAINHAGDGGFDYVNLHWYYIFQDNWPAIEAAARRDMGVFIISPSDKGGMLYKPPARLVELCAPLHPIVMNCLFCLMRPEVHTLSVGASCPTDFDLQVGAVEMLETASAQLAPIVARLRTAQIDAVGQAQVDRYAEGLPPWDATPGFMSIRTMLWLRNLVLAYDMVDYAKMRYNLLGNAEHWFPGANAAHVRQWDLEKALEKSPFGKEISDWLATLHEQLYKAPAKRLSEGG
jgi:hypothetical protein